MHGQIDRVEYDPARGTGMPEVFVYFHGIDQPLVLNDPDDSDLTVHIFEYWSTLKAHADMLDDHGAFEDEDEDEDED